MSNLSQKRNRHGLLKWSDAECRSMLHDEISCAENPCPPYHSPLEIFSWLKTNSATPLLLRSLDKFAPLFPCVSYKNTVSVWLSPPPSGAGNAIYIVVGKDMFGKTRLVGCNYFNQITEPSNNINFDFKNFFIKYDSSCTCYRHDRESLIRNAIQAACTRDEWLVTKKTNLVSESTQTMPVYLLVIDEGKPLFQTFPAIANGNHPADFSFEFIGEVL